MRYQVFASRGITRPRISAPWLWLATLLAAVASRNWTYYRLVDAKNNRTLTEWAQAEPAVRKSASR